MGRTRVSCTLSYGGSDRLELIFFPSWNMLERINVILLQLSRLLFSQRLVESKNAVLCRPI